MGGREPGLGSEAEAVAGSRGPLLSRVGREHRAAALHG